MPRTRFHTAMPVVAPAVVMAAVLTAMQAGPAAAAPAGAQAMTPELPSDVVKASFAPGSTWQPEHAVYGTNSQNDVPVTMADGTVLRVNVIYPTDPTTGQEAAGPFPVVLTQTPYGKGQGGSSTPGSAEQPGGGSPTGGANNYLVQRGFIDVVADVRGTGDSEGS